MMELLSGYLVTPMIPLPYPRFHPDIRSAAFGTERAL